MPAHPSTPCSVVICNALIRLASQLVPAGQRQDWKQEWNAEIWHRWQFLFHAGEWNRREASRLIRNCLGSFPDAAWHFASQEAVQSRIRERVRSPWLCLAGLAVSLLLVAAASSGLAATRDLLFSQWNRNSSRLLFIWLHPFVGGGDKGLPPDVVPDWARHSRLLEGIAPFNVSHAPVSTPHAGTSHPLIIATEPALFEVLRVRPALGTLPFEQGIVLDHRAWVTLFRADPSVIGSQVALNGRSYRVTGVLPPNFRFLSRQPSVYLVQRGMSDPRVMVIARVMPGISEEKLDLELRKIAENFAYYFFNSDLRLGFLQTEMFTPLRFFGVAVLISISIMLMVCRFRVRNVQVALKPENRKAAGRRVLFFLGKTILALAFVFIAGLELSRPASSVLLASKDPASGPFLVWLYILGAMGVFFWSLADQRARCRLCLRLLCFPVRIGCPGCLLLDWSGTELACTEGHGVLHVPLLAPSWDEESQHWISLDESWSGLFAHTK